MKGPSGNDGPRINEQIRAAAVRLVGDDGKVHGVMPLEDAIAQAQENDLDLVEVSPNADPPVCKILDFGKLKYERQKKRHEARKKQRVIEIKEIKLRPNIDEHDFQIKLRNVERFIDGGDKVKVTMRFRGREVVHQELGLKILDRVREGVSDRIKVEQRPQMEGRQMVMLIAPK